MEPQLLHTVEDGVATVVIHNPAKRNAMTAPMWRALPALLDGLAADPGVRVLVLTGEGDTFCSGADISSMRDSTHSSPSSYPEGPGYAGPGAEDAGAAAPGGGADGAAPIGRHATQALAVRAEEALAAFPKPTVAAVRGHCVGGGCQLAAACDLRFADERALFGVTPARLGIVYPAPATRRLVRLVGPATAKYLLFSAELVGAQHALRTGLVDEVVPHGRLGERVTAFTRVLTSRSLLTQAAAKELVDGRGWDGEGRGEGDGNGQDRSEYWAEQVESSGERAEGVAAFLERRAPRFGWNATRG
ncbi:enoyl-CoA hydratase/isomerase family protein [Streptomyces sp. NPDC050560]|uniref:enoyl-CoA hydratase/isomerase family protein n=1 Tax=Streptomyces sp. NPDC050560 TaxID=3365630 RepID=UPI0037BD60F2